MKLFQIIFILIKYINVISFKNLYILKNINPKKILFLNKKYDVKEKNKIENLKFEKINNLFELIRPNNIIPTTLLCFTGGWIMNPSLNNLIHSTEFIISIINSVLIMSASMIINDIFDVEIDKINSPYRPMASGKISKLEALLLTLIILGSTEYLTFIYLPDNLKLIIQIAIKWKTLKYSKQMKRMASSIPIMKEMSIPIKSTF